jgi:hypothetical protein
MSYTDSEIRDYAVGMAPELVTVYGAAGASPLDARTEADVVFARSQAGATPFGARHLLALGLLLAHTGTLTLRRIQAGAATPAIAVGAVNSTTVGGMSISMGNAGIVGAATAYSVSDADLSRTDYGLRFLQLRNTRARVGTPFVAVPR